MRLGAPARVRQGGWLQYADNIPVARLPGPPTSPYMVRPQGLRQASAAASEVLRGTGLPRSGRNSAAKARQESRPAHHPLDHGTMLDYAKLESRLQDCAIGHTIYAYGRVASTQDVAHTLAPTHRSGTLVISEEMTEGRGRAGRGWKSRRGCSLCLSFLLKPPLRVDGSDPAAQLAGLATLEAVASFVPDLNPRLALKWPNDIVTLDERQGPRKLAGVLIELHRSESHVEHGVLGIGINVNHREADLPQVAGPSLPPTSVRLAAGCRQDRAELLTRLCRRLAFRLSPPSYGGLRSRPWEERMITIGRQVAARRVDGKGAALKGLATGTTPEGALLLQDARGVVHIVDAADVTVREVP